MVDGRENMLGNRKLPLLQTAKKAVAHAVPAHQIDTPLAECRTVHRLLDRGQGADLQQCRDPRASTTESKLRRMSLLKSKRGETC